MVESYTDEIEPLMTRLHSALDARDKLYEALDAPVEAVTQIREKHYPLYENLRSEWRKIDPPRVALEHWHEVDDLLTAVLNELSLLDRFLSTTQSDVTMEDIELAMSREIDHANASRELFGALLGQKSLGKGKAET